MATLYALSYSPWSEKARWALDHHQVQYREREHIPLVGEPILQLIARRSGAKSASVPLFVDGSTGISDSWEIVKWADAHGRGAPLADREGCGDINARCEQGLRHARARVVVKTLASPRAQEESSEAVAPAFITPLLRPVSRFGARFLARKHAANLDTAQALDERLGEVLGELDAKLGGRDYFFDSFSAADICLACVLQAVEPIAGGYISLKPATRETWCSPQLAARFAHLLEWRDAIYAKHR